MYVSVCVVVVGGLGNTAADTVMWVVCGVGWGWWQSDGVDSFDASDSAAAVGAVVGRDGLHCGTAAPPSPPRRPLCHRYKFVANFVTLTANFVTE